MHKVLAIHYGHNASVAYSENGVIIKILSEERFTRVKNQCGFPKSSVDFILREYLDNNIDNLNKIVVIDKSGLSAKFICKNNFDNSVLIFDSHFLRKKYEKNKFFYNNFKYLYKFMKKILFNIREKKNLKKYNKLLYDHYNLPTNKIKEFDHHLTHAATFCYFDSFHKDKKYLVFTMDGEGDYKSSTVNIIENGEIKNISSNSSDASLGYLYLYVTFYLGFKPGEHEFKVMGMSPYAKKERSDNIKKKLAKIISLNKNGNFISKTQSGNFLFELNDIFKFERFDEISRASQEFLEELSLKWIDFWIEKTKIREVAVSGGVFMNVKLNKLIHEMKNVNSFFAVPSCTDDSLPIGGLYLENFNNNIKIDRINNFYFGRNFSEQYISSFIENSNLNNNFEIEVFENFQKLNDVAAELLKKNIVIARFFGLEEFGVRALGNRSIICNPQDFGNINLINKLIKKRDFWMPFTPSIIEDDIETYFINPKKVDASFMSSAFESTEKAREKLSAAIHPSDLTLRPQIVKKSINPEYYDLIKKFKNITGVGAILNTSFNLSGEPNVSSPKDAINTLQNSGLEYLILENCLLKKKLN